MGKQNNLLKKLKNPGCGVMTVVVILLILAGIFFVVRDNKLFGLSEGFEGDINNVVEKPDPKEDEVILMLFFVDWCPHCKTVKPEWKKLMKLNNTKINGKNVKIQAANAEGTRLEITT